MNGYLVIQQALVAARQDALRTEADTTRILSSTRPLPAVSAGGRAVGSNRPADDRPMAVAPRSLGAAAAADRPASIASTAAISRPKPVAMQASAGDQRLGSGCGDEACAGSVAPAA